MPAPNDSLFDSESAWPGFVALCNYMPRIDVNALKIALLYREHLPDKRYLEVGSFVGATARIACDAGYKHVLCVDTWSGGGDPDDWINELYDEEGESIFETFLKNTSNTPAQAMRMSSLCAARITADKSLDVIFLDGDHTYDAVKADIEAWLPKLKAGGVLCGHDYGIFPGVEKAVEEIFANKRLSVMGTVWMVFI
jgi:hypothetical protein